MRTLYLFAMGGTGSRVLKSLTMLLAAGVKFKENWRIKILIIDKHAENYDLKDTIDLIGKYDGIRKVLNKPEGLNNKRDFFRVEISPMFSDKYYLDIGVTNQNFSDSISLSDMGNVASASQDLTNILFSGKSKESSDKSLINLPIKIGFAGNPNLGCVVLNNDLDAKKVIENLEKEVENLRKEDKDANPKIFIISSIFGGTGAAGFPLLLKRIKDNNNLQGLDIGALIVRPYFSLEADDNSGIDSKDFGFKTNCALNYYDRTVYASLNAIYYTNNHGKTLLKNDSGLGGQRNPAHFDELAAATAIIDFMANTPANNEKFVEFSSLEKSNKNFIKFRETNIKPAEVENYSIMQINMEKEIGLPLAKFTMFLRFKRDELELFDKNHLPTWFGIGKDKAKITKDFLKADGSFMKSLEEFFIIYDKWLGDLVVTGYGFELFEMEDMTDKEIEILKLKNDTMDGNERKKLKVPESKKKEDRDQLLGKFINNRHTKTNYSEFEDTLNSFYGEKFTEDFKNPQDRLIELLSKATEKLLKNKYDFGNLMKGD